METSFPLDVRKITNTGLDGDQDWHKVIRVENLELAWARARALLQREVMYDEIEIRLFERNREANLRRLHLELVSYDINVPRTTDRLDFRFVNEREAALGSCLESPLLSFKSSVLLHLDNTSCVQAKSALLLAGLNSFMNTGFPRTSATNRNP